MYVSVRARMCVCIRVQRMNMLKLAYLYTQGEKMFLVCFYQSYNARFDTFADTFVCHFC